MFYDPDEYAHYPDMTEEKLRVLEPPNARYVSEAMVTALSIVCSSGLAHTWVCTHFSQGGRPRAKALTEQPKL